MLKSPEPKIIILLLSVIFSILLSPTMARAQSYEWWNSTWHYRLPVEVNATDYERYNSPVDLEVNFTDELQSLGVSGALDNDSIRVLEYNSTGSVLYELPSQFEKDSGYDASTNAAGTLSWIMNGTTPSNQKRYFFIYFDTAENPKPSPSYVTDLTYSWDGEEFWLNNSKRAFKVDTDRGENTSGVYYATNYTHELFNTPPSEKTVEYVKLSNGTDSFMYDLRNNASFDAGPVKITVTQTGKEALWNAPDQKTGKAKIVKKYTFYRNNPWVEVQQRLEATDSITRNSAKATALALDTERAFGSSTLSGSSTDPFSWMSAYVDSGEGLGVINTEEQNTTNYYADFYSAAVERIGINLTSTAMAQGDPIFEEATVLFNDEASDQPVQNLRNRLANPANITKTASQTYSVETTPDTDYNFYNRNETATPTANITQDTHNLTSSVNATLDRGTDSTGDDLTLALYDDGTHGDATSGDSVYTNQYTFPTSAATGLWNLTVRAYDAENFLLTENWTTFSLTDEYNLNLTVSNPLGSTSRTVYANLTVKNFRNGTGIGGASVSCSYDSTPVTNITDESGGNYSINFTAPSTAGIWNLTCNASKYNNSGTDRDQFYTEEPTTTVDTELQPDNYTLSNITQSQNQSFVMNVTLENTGNGTAYSSNVSLSLPSSLAANSTFEKCGDVTSGQTCTKFFEVTALAATAPGIFQVNATGEWRNLDSSLNSSQDTSNVTVASNPALEVVQDIVEATIGEGQEAKAGEFTVNSTGNDKVVNISFACASGEVCQNFTLDFESSFSENLSAGSWGNVSVNVSVPEGFPVGNYSGVINTTSANNGFDTITLNVSVPENRAWRPVPDQCFQSALVGTSGVLCEIQVNDTGNQPVNFTLTTLTANHTWINQTNLTVSGGGSEPFNIYYNATNLTRGTYNSSYQINATTSGASPPNRTLPVSMQTVFGPIVESLTAETVEQLGTIELTANITDRSDQGINWVKANVTRPNGTKDMLNLTNVTPNTPGGVSRWKVNYSNTTQRGNYHLVLYSEDNIGGTRQTSDTFAVHARLNVSLRTGWTDYFTRETGTVYYNLTDGLGSPLEANVTIQTEGPDDPSFFSEGFTTNENGSLEGATFEIPDDSTPGNYSLKARTTFNSPWINGTVNSTSTSNFDVYERYESQFESPNYFFPNSDFLKFYLSLQTDHEIQEPDSLRIKVIETDSNQTLFTGNRSGFKVLDSTNHSILYEYKHDPTGELDTGIYTAQVWIGQGSRETTKLLTFRVSEGGPYDLGIIDITPEVQQGGDQKFSLRLENKGEVGKDVYVDYWIAKNGTTYDKVENEAVFVGANSNRTIDRSLHVYSDQATGTYELHAKLNYSTAKKEIETSRTFKVVKKKEEEAAPAGGGVAPPVEAAPTPVYELKILNVFPEELMIKQGGTRYVVVEVKNTGNQDLHKISAYFSEIPDWFELVEEVSTLSPDATGYLIVRFKVPKGTKPKVYTSKLKVLASEVEKKQNYRIEVFGSKKKLLRARVKKARELISDLEQKAARVAEEGGDVTTSLKLLGRAGNLVSAAEDYLEEGKLLEASKALDEARNTLQEVSYRLSVAKPAEPKLIPVIPWTYIAIAAVAIVAVLVIFLIAKRWPSEERKPRKRHREEERIPTDVREWIEENLDEGCSPESLRKSLKEAGHDPSYVDVFLMSRKEKGGKAKKPEETKPEAVRKETEERKEPERKEKAEKKEPREEDMSGVLKMIQEQFEEGEISKETYEELKERYKTD